MLLDPSLGLRSAEHRAGYAPLRSVWVTSVRAGAFAFEHLAEAVFLEWDHPVAVMSCCVGRRVVWDKDQSTGSLAAQEILPGWNMSLRRLSSTSLLARRIRLRPQRAYRTCVAQESFLAPPPKPRPCSGSHPSVDRRVLARRCAAARRQLPTGFSHYLIGRAMHRAFESNGR